MVRSLRNRGYYIWTIGGAVLVGNNLINFRRPQWQTSTLARQHKLITCLVLAAYGWHFLVQEDS